MIGVVIVSHENIGREMITATQRIIPDCLNIVCVSIESDQSPEVSHSHIRKAIDEVDQGDGVILLTDMFGGTPSNRCLPFLKDGKVEIISGFNLPMIIKLAGSLDKMSFDKLAAFIQNYGQKNIVIAGEVLEGKVKY